MDINRCIGDGMKKYSIIVPVYNGENTIERCVNSLVKQSYKDIEIILVNDGSKDNTLKVLKDFKKKYKDLIVVVDKENGGVGSARNAGLDKATGDYVTFVDADDALEKDAISYINKIIKHDEDMVYSGLKRISEHDEKVLYELHPKKCLWSEFKYTSTQFKIYKREYLNKNKIRYSSFKINEDTYFVLSSASKSSKVLVDSETKYLNYVNSNSVTANLSTKKYDILDLLKEINKNVDFSKYPVKYVKFFYIKTIVQNIIMQLKARKYRELINLFNENKKWYKETFGKLRLYWQKDETFGVNFIVNTFILLSKINCQFIIIGLMKLVMGR